MGAEPRGWVVKRGPDGELQAAVGPLPNSPSSQFVCIDVEAAGFNYKDALACDAHPGVVRKLPLVPGIDVAGRLRSSFGKYAAGTPVVATGNGLGETMSGGFATEVWAPPAAIIKRPPNLSAIAAMAMGTAGLSALLAVERLQAVIDWNYQARLQGNRNLPWLITGASGGVGMLAVAATALAGFQVIACTRKKKSLSDTLLSLGASTVQSPEEALPSDKKPLSSARYLGVIDTVGGELLANILRVVAAGGAVASIGNAGGVALPTTVYPFILRGITLAGIDAAGLPSREKRQDLWAKLGVLWPLMNSVFPVRHIGLREIGEWAVEMRSGRIGGRAVVIPEKEVRDEYAHD
ncbi:MAG: zinc-binding dehydrogenase [Planctomycetaceae bacterium]|nr:zinc-binding dehydrogenase [Planctomycetaceae bacterium]